MGKKIISIFTKNGRIDLSDLFKGGPGSGCRGENCGRPRTGGSATPESRLQDKVYYAKVSSIVAQTERNGGSTTDINTGKSPRDGYVVSPYKEREWKVPTKDFHEKTVDAYLEQNEDLLNQEDHYFGTWHNEKDNNVYFDVVMVKPSMDEAKQIARENKQLAIYGITEGQEIKTEDE